MTPAASPDAYVAELDGWRREAVIAFREATLAAGPMVEQIKWGHLVYLTDGPVCLIRAEENRVLFGFWRGKRLRGLAPRLKASGKYELANLILTEAVPIDVAAMTELVKAAMALNAEFGDPTRIARGG